MEIMLREEERLPMMPEWIEEGNEGAWFSEKQKKFMPCVISEISGKGIRIDFFGKTRKYKIVGFDEINKRLRPPANFRSENTSPSIRAVAN